MRESYIDYAMSVIVGRALPDVRDGLKPVHRRILWAMHKMGLTSKKPYKKSATIVGEVLGKYHPHGDVAIYDSVVRMAQDFSMRYLLIDGHGNFGSVDGDSAAAMRYTEVRTAEIAEELLSDIEKETVEFQQNYDGSLKEPKILPAKLPNLLINGSSGIAVGMATNVPPHNLREVVDGIIALIENPDITVSELVKYIKGPDFPTAGLICGREGILRAYETGKGKITVRAKAEILEEKGKTRIIITQLPYQVNKALLLEYVAELLKRKKIERIRDLRDESSREGLRIVVELQNDVNPNIILNQLYKHTNLQITFGINFLALLDVEPKVFTLKEIIVEYIKHRKEITRKRISFELRKAKERAHLLSGLIIALEKIDEVIEIIKKSKDVEIARISLRKRFKLTDVQTRAILDMRLQKLTNLEREKVREEKKELQKIMKELSKVLESEERILEIIKTELLELRKKYGDERRTEITGGILDFSIEDLIPEEDIVITLTHSGYIKRVPFETYKTQRRKGKGVLGMDTKEKDFVEHIIQTSTHSNLLFFTNLGKIHLLKAFEVPLASRTARGKALANLLRLERGERIRSILSTKEFDKNSYIFFATKMGIVKKTSLDDFSNIRAGGIIAIKLREEDNLIDVRLTDGNREVLLATKMGRAMRFKEEEVRAMGRSARGVFGVKLKDRDEVVSVALLEKGSCLLTVTQNGFSKRTPIELYPLRHRGGFGIVNVPITKKNGDVVAVKSVNEGDELIVISEEGKLLKIRVSEIPKQGRYARGVKTMVLGEGDRVAGVERIRE